jgi:MFS transporter, AAHS family, 4-hydroxybenzoate transporter
MPAQIDISRVIEETPVTAYQVVIFALCTFLCLADGLDTFVPAVTGPAMRTEFGLGPQALGSIFSAGLAGNLVGYFIGGPLSDKYGRRWLMIINATVFAVFTFLTSQVHTLEQLLAMRFLCGIGLAVCLSNALAMIADFAPKRLAIPLVIIAQVGVSLGSIIVHSSSAYLVPNFGWRSVYYLGTAAGLLMAFLLLVLMPESIRYLGLHHPNSTRTGSVLSRITGTVYPAGTTFVLGSEKLEGAPLIELFRNGRLGVSLSLWLMFFAGGCMIFTLTQWMPSLLKTAGLSFTLAVSAGATHTSAGIVGSLLTTFVSARLKRPVLLICIQFVLAGIGLLAIGATGNDETLVFVAVAFTGFFMVSGWLLLYAIGTVAYPEFMRATGLSMCTVAGRVGAVVGPLLVGEMLSFNFGTQAVFTALGSLAIILVVGGAAYLSLSRPRSAATEPAGRSSEVPA